MRAIEKPIRAVDPKRAGPPPHCPRCGYSLCRAPSPRCPECGINVAKFREVKRLRDDARAMLADERAAWRALVGGRLARFADFAVGSAALLAAGILLLGCWRHPETSVLLIPLLTLAVPCAYYQWSTGIGARHAWFLAGLVWWTFLAWAASLIGFFGAW